MKTTTYINKYGKIYGVSYKYAFGRWERYFKIFHDAEKAEKWLKTEEYDFRTRELISKTTAKKVWGYKGE